MGPSDLVGALLDLAVPRTCGSCGVPVTDRPCCPACLRDAWGWCFPGGPRRVAPDPAPAGLPPVLACGVNDGALRRLLHAYKDEGRRDLRPVLVDLLVPGLRAAAAAIWPTPPLVVLAPVPTSPAARRRRGDRPLEDLVAAAAGRVEGLGCRRLLASTGAPADQALLGALGRAANLRGTVRPRRAPSGELAGGRVPVLLVDDLLTTGATLGESARALRSVGLPVVGAVVVAATRRRTAQRPPGEPGRHAG